MALKKPLVLSSGQIEQLQSTDTLASAESMQFTNDNGGSVVIGAPVYMAADDHIDKARANAVGTTNVVGLVSDTSIASGAVGGVQIDGVLAATTGQWDAVTGDTGGLIKDAFYYLDAATAGKLTQTAPSVAGQFVLPVGIGISTTEMKINILARIKL